MTGNTVAFRGLKLIKLLFIFRFSDGEVQTFLKKHFTAASYDSTKLFVKTRNAKNNK